MSSKYSDLTEQLTKTWFNEECYDGSCSLNKFFRGKYVNIPYNNCVFERSLVLKMDYLFCFGNTDPGKDECVLYTRPIRPSESPSDVLSRTMTLQTITNYAKFIRKQVEDVYRKEQRNFKIQWMLAHEYTLADLIRELEEEQNKDNPNTSLEFTFAEWEFWRCFDYNSWPNLDEYMEYSNDELIRNDRTAAERPDNQSMMTPWHRNERAKLRWMLDKGLTLEELMGELEKIRKISSPLDSLATIFRKWERSQGADYPSVI